MESLMEPGPKGLEMGRRGKRKDVRNGDVNVAVLHCCSPSPAFSVAICMVLSLVIMEVKGQNLYSSYIRAFLPLYSLH